MIRRTNVTDLVLPFIIVAALTYAVLKLSYESLPPFQWFVVVPIGALGGLELVMARRVRNAVRHIPDAKPMDALAIARAVALAKASALGAAAVGGGAIALVVRVLPDAGRTDAGLHDLRVGLALLVVCIGLALAALVLERSAIDPNSTGKH